MGRETLVRNGQWQAEQWLERRRQRAEGEHVQQYVYVLEANLVFHNGVTLPLPSEFLSYAEGDPDDHKQDCELKAFYRLTARLKAYFPRLPILLLLDGLYPNGPLMALCHHYGWQFMIVLPDKWLPSMWEEVEALKPRLPHHRKHPHWHGRQQQFWWVNDITYSYEGDRKSLLVHVVGCEETWQEVDPESGELIDKQTQHVWLSSQRLDPYNVHERCNLGARQRLWDRDQPPGRKVPGLSLRTRLLVYLERDEGLPLPDAPGALGQCPGTGHQTGCSARAHTGRTGVFALGARELRASLATA
jgi:hypothetical protein